MRPRPCPCFPLFLTPSQVGIVGRTGCGKSTLVLALYRLVEPCGGRVLLDGIDTARIGLRDLRSRLTLVPQVRLGSGP